MNIEIEAIAASLIGSDGLSESVSSVSEQILSEYNRLQSLINLNPHETMSKSIPFDKLPRVYFLMQGDYVAYVGQTAHLIARITQHIVDRKRFDAIAYIDANDDLLLVEAVNINYHNPDMNKSRLSRVDIYKRIAKTMTFI